jgi:hypothetical protein
MEILKEIIRPGVYTYIHPKTGKPEKFVATAEKIRRYCEQGNAMLAAGLSVPVPFEHQPDAVPMTEAERAANNLVNNAGWTNAYKVGDVKEKGPDGKDVVVKDVLFGKLDIADPDVYKKLPTTIKFVSPWVSSFTDGNGRRWDDVIGHVALTTRPRITAQQPFAHDMAAALSIVAAIPEHWPSALQLADGIPVSRAGLMAGTKPRFPIAFSLLAGIKLSKEEMEEYEEEEDEEDDEEVKKKKERSPLANIGGEEEEVKDVTIYEMVEHLLRVHGFSPPDGMDKMSFVRDVYETLMAKLHQLQAKGEEKKAGPMDQQGQQQQQPKKPLVQETPTMYASLEEIAKIADPKEREIAGKVFSLFQEEHKTKVADLEAQNAKYKKQSEIALSLYGETRGERVKRLMDRLPATSREKLKKMMAAPSAALSLGDDGNVVDPMKETLEIMEESIQNLPALLSTPAPMIKEHKQPEGTGGITPERAAQVVDEVMKNTGHRHVA